MIWLLVGYIWLFIHRPFEIWPWLGDLRIERVYMLIVLLVWLFTPNKQLIRNPLNKAFAFFFVTMVAAWLLSPCSYAGTSVVEKYAKIGVFYVLVMTTVRDERRLRTLILAFLISMVLYMLHSLWEYYCGRFVHRMGTFRMIGIDASNAGPNMFAATLVYAFPMLFPFWSKDASRWTKLLLVGYLVLAIVCILLTGSRTGLLGLLLFGLITVLFISQRRFRILACLALAAPLVWVALPQDRQERYLSIISSSHGTKSGQTSANARLEYIKIAIQIYQDNPLLGVGPGGFQVLSGTGQQPHNLYGQILSETGTVGALAFLGLLGAFYANHREMRSICHDFPDLRQGFPFKVTTAITISVLLLLFVGMAGHNLFRYTWLWIGAFQAVALLLIRQKMEDVMQEEYVSVTDFNVNKFLNR